MWEAELRILEESLWRTETRGDRVYMDSVLAAGFMEFGRSGRSYSRDEILGAAIDEIDAVLPLPDLGVRLVGDEIALVTYRSEVRVDGDLQIANRASLWRRVAPGQWLLEFHQGTPTRSR